MADNPLGSHIQGCLDEGQPAVNERPVLVAGKDTTTGAITDFPITSGAFPVSGTVTANQGTPNAGGAQAWPISFDPSINGTNVTITGTIAASNQDVILPCAGLGEVSLDVFGVFNGTLTALVTNNNGGSYATVLGYDVTANVVKGNFNTPGNMIRLNAAGYTHIRILGSGWVSGTATIVLRGVLPAGVVAVINPISIKDPNNNAISILSTVDPQAEAAVLWCAAREMIFDGSLWWRLRTPSIFKTVQATAAGSTALWAPAAGKKFRLMKYRVTVTGNAIQAAGGVLTLTLLDAAAATNQTHDIFVPAAALSTAGSLYDTGWIDLGNGILSAVANNVLNINLSAALTGGNVRAIVCGTEE